MNRRTLLRGAGAFVVSAAFVRSVRANAALTLAVVPQFPAIETQKAWAPVLERISAATGIALQLQTYQSIPQFEQDFAAGGPDLAFMNPYHAVMAWRTQNYLPLVRDGEKPLTGILVAPTSGTVRAARDLQGKRIAFPAPNAFGASLYMRALLAEVHKIQFEALYVKTHTNAYRHVLTDSAEAAGGIRATLEREAPPVRDSLAVIYETPPAAPHPVSAHPRVPAAQRDALRDAFLKEANTPEGLALLKPTTLLRPVAADYARDYAPLERLKLDRYAVSE